MTDYLLVTNAAAGSTDEASIAAAQAVLAAHGDVQTVATSSPDELDALLSADDRTVVVAGGDGSLHAVANALYRLGLLDSVTVGLVPLGTGNDFARGTGLPLDPAEAAELVVSTSPQRIDLILDSHGCVTVNNVHLGVGAQASAASVGLKPRLGRLGYAAGATVVAIRPELVRVRVHLDGRLVHRGRVVQVAVGNTAFVGGGTELVPGADPTNRRLTVIVSSAIGRLARVAYAFHLRRGEHHHMEEVKRLEGRVVSVRGEAFGVSSDGELSGPHYEMQWRVLPAALRVHLPASPPA